MADPSLASTIAGSMSLPGLATLELRGEGAGVFSDEDRVTRGDRQPRLVSIARRGPPETFAAGALQGWTSSLLRPALDTGGPSSPFEGGERGIAIAALFHSNENDRYAGVPPVLAELVTNDEADVLATAYAPSDGYHGKAPPFDVLLKGDGSVNGRFVPPLVEGDHEWMRRPLPAEVFSKPEQKCLATAIYFEARGESPKGQAAVAQVILNRVRNPAYPNTICKVVYQNDSWINRCQFSFACDGIPDLVTSRASYELAGQVAMAVTAGKIFVPEVASSTHYYASYVNPGWARTMERMTQIGSHIFYRTYGGGWT